MPAPDMQLVKLDPHWVEHEGKRCGVSFECPEHGTHTGPNAYCRQVVQFTPAIEGGHVASWQDNKHIWQRKGESFEALTLTPSVRAGCGWHGFVTAGMVTSCGDSK
jgi:hypothetical protein